MSVIYEILRHTKFPYLKLLPPEYSYGGVKFNSKGLKVLFYLKLVEMLANNSPPINDLISLGVDINRILRAEIQCNRKYGVQAMLRKTGYRQDENTFQRMFSLEKCQRVFQYVFGILDSNMPTMVLPPNSIEDLIFPDYSDAKKAKVYIMLSLQQEYGYERAKAVALSRGLSRTFVENCKHIIIRQPELQGILLRMLNEVLEYRPLFNTS